MPSSKNFEVLSCYRLGRQKKQLSHTNEDCRWIDRTHNLYMVADGLGGHGHGDEASRITLESIAHKLSRMYLGLRNGIFQTEDIPVEISSAMGYANHEILCPLATYSPSLENFATTVALLYCHSSQAYIAHVGDSRVYRFRDGSLSCLTADDRELKDAQHPLAGSYVTQSLGKEAIEIHQSQLEIATGDTFLLTTDGLTDYATDGEIEQILRESSFADAPKLLVHLANYPQDVAAAYADYWQISKSSARKMLGGRDNITFILLKAGRENNGKAGIVKVSGSGL
ncbi:protein phosphatase 2C domain-containing protein [Candidatus Woesearchaeota archaeon]|nr:protein phosphatase 2C domain-containing protein [Candidatus Woesearchaeota archaeon]